MVGRRGATWQSDRLAADSQRRQNRSRGSSRTLEETRRVSSNWRLAQNVWAHCVGRRDTETRRDDWLGHSWRQRKLRRGRFISVGNARKTVRRAVCGRRRQADRRIHATANRTTRVLQAPPESWRRRNPAVEACAVRPPTSRVQFGLTRKTSRPRKAGQLISVDFAHNGGSMPDLAVWQWLLGGFCAVLIGLAKTGAPGAATLTVPLMVMTVGDARHAAGWTAPILITGDIFAVAYWRRHAESRTLFSLIPWVAAGMVVGGLALSLNEPVLRRILGVIVLTMLAVNLLRPRNPGMKVGGHPSSYGIAAGFATTVANAAGPVMSMYLMTKQLPKEQFVATGAWFFLVVNIAKLPIYAAHHLFTPASLLF